MRVISRDVYKKSDGERAPVTGFAGYVSNSKPVLMLCDGWEDYSDGYDEYAIRMSHDNGRTWTEPAMKFKGFKTDEGKVRYGEPAAFWDADKEKLIVLIDKSLYPGDVMHNQTRYQVVEHIYDGRTGKWSDERDPQLAPGLSLAVSFSFPIKTRRGNIMVPAMQGMEDADGRIIVDKRSGTPVSEPLTIIGRWNRKGGLDWKVGRPVEVDRDATTRGMDENVYAELRSGRIAMVIRASNAGAHELPGYKWLCFSDDDGLNWSKPVPVPATGGPPIESGANGSAFFRSIKNGRLYWMGNLALRGERPKGNWPRSPLVIVEVQEEPFALKRETIFAVDERGYNDSPRVQMSNFRFYQDRATGDVVIFLTRYGEFSEKEWMLADYYRCRVQMP